MGRLIGVAKSERQSEKIGWIFCSFSFHWRGERHAKSASSGSGGQGWKSLGAFLCWGRVEVQNSCIQHVSLPPLREKGAYGKNHPLDDVLRRPRHKLFARRHNSFAMWSAAVAQRVQLAPPKLTNRTLSCFSTKSGNEEATLSRPRIIVGTFRLQENFLYMKKMQNFRHPVYRPEVFLGNIWAILYQLWPESTPRSWLLHPYSNALELSGMRHYDDITVIIWN